jgi:hypothetical protein
MKEGRMDGVNDCLDFTLCLSGRSHRNNKSDMAKSCTEGRASIKRERETSHLGMDKERAEGRGGGGGW